MDPQEGNSVLRRSWLVMLVLFSCGWLWSDGLPGAYVLVNEDNSPTDGGLLIEQDAEGRYTIYHTVLDEESGEYVRYADAIELQE